jgi:P4 family phage/plasmid primase-like protien
MNINGLLASLGIHESTPSGKELIIECPKCQGPKFSINTETGFWQCWRGCGQGNPWSMVELFKPGIAKKDVMALLKETACDDGLDTDAPRTPAPQSQDDHRAEQIAKYRIYETELMKACQADLERFQRAKGFEPSIMMKFGPKIHNMKPHLCLPVSNPGCPEELDCGCIRAEIDGKKITVGKEPNGDWIKVKYAAMGTAGLYGIDWLRSQDPSEPIIYAEGWGDMAAAMSLGFQATACSLGAGKWHDGFSDIFRDRVVFIIQDRDTAGVNASLKLAGKLNGVAAEVRIVDLPYPLTPSNGKDLKDFIQDDHATREQVQALCEAAPIFDHKQVAAQAKDEKAKATKAKNDTTLAQTGIVKLPDKEPDTVANLYEAQSPVLHHWNRRDGWSMYKDNQHQLVDMESVRKYLSRYMARCVVLAGKEWVRLSMTPQSKSSVMSALMDLDDVWLDTHQCAPCSIDGSLDADHVLPMANGLLDFSVWPPVMHDHTRSFYALSYLPYDYDPDAKCPMWDKYLVDSTVGNQELMDSMQLFAGYCLMPEHGQQIFMMVNGDPGTGKSQFLEVLRNMLGDENVSDVKLHEMVDANKMYMTFQKRLNMCDETLKVMDSKSENLLKSYVSGGKVTMHIFHKDKFQVTPTAKIIIACDRLPQIKGDLRSGIWRRMVIVPFDHVIPKSERILDFAKTIHAKGETPGILNWALAGLRRIQELGKFPIPGISAAIKEEHQRDCMPEIQFFQDHFDACLSEDENVVNQWALTRDFLVEIYNRETVGSDNKYAKNVKSFMPAAKAMFKRRDGSSCVRSARIYMGGIQQRVWLGLSLKQDSPYYSDFCREGNRLRGNPVDYPMEMWG